MNKVDVVEDDGQYGIFIFRDQPSSKVGVVDIIALHGLNGHYKKTWTGGDGSNWLKDDAFLPKHLPDARIMSYGYNSQVQFSKSEAGIEQFAEGLLSQIEGLRRHNMEKKMPIIFICHSLGGIVVKKVRFSYPWVLQEHVLLIHFRP